MWGKFRSELDIEAQGLEARFESIGNAFRMQSVEVVGPLFAVAETIANQVVDHQEDAVGATAAFLRPVLRLMRKNRVVKKVLRRLMRAAAQAASTRARRMWMLPLVVRPE